LSEGGRTLGLRFECTECGKCCTNQGEYAHVYLNDEEVRELADLFEIRPSEFRARYTFVDPYGWTQLSGVGDQCAFLDRETQRCTVYSARPTQCRTFPFWRELVKDGEWTQEGEVRGVGLSPSPSLC